MNLKDSFLKSYSQCISNMDMTTIYPYTEHEVQPNYSSLWYDSVIMPLLNIDIFIPINPSILRSMLVMDLIDCYILKKPKDEIFEWYCKQLTHYYDDDIFSLNKNTPKTYSFALEDYTYFPETKKATILMVKLFQLCYLKYLDIFADNGYEVIGPFYLKNKTYTITKFNNVIPNKNIIFVSFSRGIIQGTIDMFGHSTFQLKDVAVEVDGDIILEDEINEYIKLCDDEIQKETDYNLNIELHHKFLNSRITRYPNILIDINSFNNIPFFKQDRITKVEQLCSYIRI